MDIRRSWRIAAAALWLVALSVGFATGSVPIAFAILVAGGVIVRGLYRVFAAASQGRDRERASTPRVNERGELVEDK